MFWFLINKYTYIKRVEKITILKNSVTTGLMLLMRLLKTLKCLVEVIVILEYALTHPTANDPERANPSDAGLDVFYSPENENQAIAIEPGASRVIPTGLRFGVPNYMHPHSSRLYY